VGVGSSELEFEVMAVLLLRASVMFQGRASILTFQSPAVGFCGGAACER